MASFAGAQGLVPGSGKQLEVDEAQSYIENPMYPFIKE